MGNVAWMRIVYAVATPFLVWLALAVATDAVLLNPILILVLISMSVGVVVAFIPNLLLFFRKDRPLDVFAMVVLGVTVGWLSNIARPLVPLIIDLFPNMMWLRDTDAVSFGLSMTIYAGAIHLAAPSIDKRGKIPSARWARIGIIAGVGAAIGLVIVNWGAISAMIWRDEAGIHPALYNYRDRQPLMVWPR